MIRKAPKPKKCENADCDKMFVKQRIGQRGCDYTCCMKIVQQDKEKAVKKEWNKEKKVVKDKLKSKSEYEADLQKLVNECIRLIDFSAPCISSAKTNGQFQAGHYYGRLSHPAIRYHAFNIYNQTAHENNHKSGNPIGYKEGLINTFGLAHFQYVESLKGLPLLHLSVEEIKEKIVLCRVCVKWLKSLDREYSKSERIDLRVELNARLGIYL